jgi:hypothetical protein
MHTLGIILFLGFGLLIILPFAILVIVLIIKGKNQSWAGRIVDKNENEVEDDGRVSTYYSVTIELEDGKERKIAVDSKRYGEWKVVDKLEKKKGDTWPQKV